MQKTSKSKIERSIRQEYDLQLVDYQLLEKEVLELIENACKKNKWIFVHRLKRVESYSLKLLTGRTDGYRIDDFLACTIVVPNLNGIAPAKDLVAACFNVLDEKPSEFVYHRPTEFNFDNIRMYCELKNTVQKKIFSELKFEIQIKTLLDYAWSEATHDFSYKGDSVSWARERLAAQIKASLNSIDLSIYDMDSISQSSFLNKRNKKYEALSAVLDFINIKFNVNSNTAVPEDAKRLSEEVSRLLSCVHLSLKDLDEALEKETELGRGYSTLNLSIYSIILVALFHQQKDKVSSGLSRPKKGRNTPKIVIPSETNIKENFDVSTFKNVTFL